MGEYFIAANPAKRQYISPIGRNKLRGIASKTHRSFCDSIALLVCKSYELEVRQPLLPLAGAWHGDPIFITGDYEPPGGLTAELGLAPGWNLYSLAREEFEDITYGALASVMEVDEDLAEDLAGWASDHENILLKLGHIVFTYQCRPLERSLTARVGVNWTKRYKEIRDSHRCS
jgi:hypothetical protein